MVRLLRLSGQISAGRQSHDLKSHRGWASFETAAKGLLAKGGLPCPRAFQPREEWLKTEEVHYQHCAPASHREGSELNIYGA
jgi:hypothetical protein